MVAHEARDSAPARSRTTPSIVNITSIAGVRPVGSSMAYSMTKAALNQMTLLLAKSYGPIRVNAVAPGLVATPLDRRLGRHACRRRRDGADPTLGHS